MMGEAYLLGPISTVCALTIIYYAAVVSSSASNCFVQRTFGDSVEKAMLKRYHTISSYQILRNSIKQLMSP